MHLVPLHLLPLAARFVAISLFLFGGIFAFAQAMVIPPIEAEAAARLAASTRHGEWVTVTSGSDKVDAWVVYPERSDKAPVVIVVHEIFGLSDWVRAVTDQLAAEGFVAVAPDFISGKAPDGKGSRSVTPDAARGLIATLTPAEISSRIDAVARYATSLPAATKEFGIIGFCWGGGISFGYATTQPDLDAAVAFYGTSPATETLARVNAPVLGLYGGNDARVNATVPAAETELKRLGRRFEIETYAGAGHGFLRQQQASAANLEAAKKAWPRMIAFLKQTLAPKVSAAVDSSMWVAAAWPVPGAVAASVGTMPMVECVCPEMEGGDDLALGSHEGHVH